MANLITGLAPLACSVCAYGKHSFNSVFFLELELCVLEIIVAIRMRVDCVMFHCTCDQRMLSVL